MNGDRRQTGIKSRDDPGCAVIGTAVLDREFNGEDDAGQGA